MLQGDDEANEWLELAIDQMYQQFNRSNFQQEVHELYYDLVTFGTAAMYVEGDQDGLRFQSRHIAEIYISQNQHDIVDTVFRKFRLSARAMAQRFGEDKLPQACLKDLKNDQYNEHDIIHAVFPRGETTGKLSKMSKPFASVYYHADTKMLLSEGGYDELCFCVPRMSKDSTSSYGRSVSMNALPDTKMLNKMCEVTIRAAQKQIDCLLYTSPSPRD